MFPIIPQYFVGKSGTNFVTNMPVQSTTQVSKIQSREVDIVASAVIEKNLESKDIEISEILCSRSNVHGSEKAHIFPHNNQLQCNTNSWSWLKQVHLAEDCHSYNVELNLSPCKPHLRIRSTRKILSEEKLILWFSRDLVAIFQIPYLTLSNIRGERQYICHKCQFQCEMPNPLKIHLSLDCGRLSKADLWNRLQLNHGPIVTVTPISAIVSSNTQNEKSQSAFKPYKKSSPTEESSKSIRPHLPDALMKDQKLPDFSQNLLYKQAVEMEAIVSHMGRIKQGHLCIYCGKIYSRKYGLKIHIRTHTGFKPLKCRFCLRPFGDPSNLNKHVRLHSEGDTPYKCEKCSKILVRKRDLDRHMKSRH